MDNSNGVDDLVNLTNRLVVEQEDDWEVNEEAAADFGKRSLMGRIVAKRGITGNLFQTMFSRIWRNVLNWKVKVLEGSTDANLIGLSFHSQQDARWVLDKQPWLFNGGFLILEEWPGTGNWQDAKLDQVFSWVKIRGFPLNIFTLNNVKRISAMAGEVSDIKWNSTQQIFLNNFVRVRIGFPLYRSIFVGRFVPSNGNKVWVQFKFEKLPLLCFKCGIWGHEQLDCENEEATELDVDGTVVPKYGSWLKDDDPTPNGFIAFHMRDDERSVDADLDLTHGQQSSSPGAQGVDDCRPVLVDTQKSPPVAVVGNNGTPMMVERGDGSYQQIRELGIVGSVNRTSTCDERGEVLPTGPTIGPKLNDSNLLVGRGMGVKASGAAGISQRRRLSIKNKARALGKGKEISASSALCEVAGGSHSGLGRGQEDELDIRVDSSSPGHIAGVVSGTDFDSWNLTCFYGNPDKQLRKFSWELLQNIGRETGGPWLCIGDFNEIVSLSEKVGGRMKSARAMEEFRVVIDMCQLIDFCTCKTELTWCNGHRDRGVMERLDRGLCNEEWLQLFEGADVKVLDWWESDHRALVVNLPIRGQMGTSSKGGLRSRFHFEEAWCEEDECKEIIQSNWDRGGSVDSAIGFRRKSKSCGVELKRWSLRKKKQLNEELRKAKKILNKLSNDQQPERDISINNEGSHMMKSIPLETHPSDGVV
ncbi:hypothetical protein G4B88_024881 [Cannabis sativa]|uniref:CCHC-type domain-containing protein n=1 Tax=Cannabis sativa TaxID=3483 RepID=A0A7J6G8Z3_CANSA|nr:hypothetical protein G4B88_024881 [Cannabis sativa]